MNPAHTYTVLVEREGDTFGASVPDLPGVFSRGDSIEEVERNVREAIELWMEEARSMNQPIPEPAAEVHVLKIAV
jgi:predicted RNase H-like HicB family nuclease